MFWASKLLWGQCFWGSTFLGSTFLEGHLFLVIKIFWVSIFLRGSKFLGCNSFAGQKLCVNILWPHDLQSVTQEWLILHMWPNTIVTNTYVTMKDNKWWPPLNVLILTSLFGLKCMFREFRQKKRDCSSISCHEHELTYCVWII